MRTLGMAVLAAGAMAFWPGEGRAQLFGSSESSLKPVGKPVGTPVGTPVGGQPFLTPGEFFGLSAPAIGQPPPGRIVAPVPSIPTPENQSFFGKLYERIASLFPFAPRISAGPQTGWFPSLRRRNVERHRWPDWQLE